MADKVAMANDAGRNDETERALGRALAIGIPVVTVGAAIVVWNVFSPGPALLVVGAGTLSGVIALLWASLRTLSGDAPLDERLVAVNVTLRASSSESPAERKRRVLRALKDLEHEHAVGKIDDVDYAQISARYREDAKDIMREMDVEIEPLRAKAEELARTYLAKRGLGEKPAAENGKALAKERASEEEEDAEDGAHEEARDEIAKAPARLACPKCATSNEPDASFCKKCGTPLAANEEPGDATV